MLKDEQIFDILDGTATEDILLQHAYEMAHSTAYQAYFKEMEALHTGLMNMPLEQPSASFTESVMAAAPVHQPVVILVKRKNWAARLPQMILGLMAVAVFSIITLALFYAPGNIAYKTPLIPFHQEIRNFLTGDFIKLVALLNLIVLLALFDRKVLKPYFNHPKVTLS